MLQAGLKAKVPFTFLCGGNAECCTCHCFFPKEIFLSQDYEKPETRELNALNLCEGATDESRLACKVKVIKAFDGHTFRLLEMD